MGGAMHARVDALAPRVCLAIEIVEVREGDPRPQARLDVAHGALDFALGLRRIRLADTRGHPNGDHKIRKTGVPSRLLLFHFQEHALHAIGQGRFRQAAEVLKGFHQTANKGWGIAAFDKGHKAHARIAQYRRKPVEFMHLTRVFIDKLAPIELDLLSWFGLIPLDWRMPSHLWPQWVDVFLEDADPSRVAYFLQAYEDDLAIGAMIFRDPFLDLLFVGIKLGWPPPTRLADHCLRVFQIFAHGRARYSQVLCNVLHTLSLFMKIMYG